MYQVRDNRTPATHLVAHICARPAIIVDLCDAATFIGVHGDHTRLWVVAETAVKCADRNLLLIDQAAKTLENAPRREGMLDSYQYPCDALQCCILMLIGASDGSIMFAFISAMIHIVPATTTNTMRTPKASASTLLVLSGPLVMCRKNTR